MTIFKGLLPINGTNSIGSKSVKLRYVEGNYARFELGSFIFNDFNQN